MRGARLTTHTRCRGVVGLRESASRRLGVCGGDATADFLGDVVVFLGDSTDFLGDATNFLGDSVVGDAIAGDAIAGDAMLAFVGKTTSKWTEGLDAAAGLLRTEFRGFGESGLRAGAGVGAVRRVRFRVRVSCSFSSTSCSQHTTMLSSMAPLRRLERVTRAGEDVTWGASAHAYSGKACWPPTSTIERSGAFPENGGGHVERV